MGDVRYLVTVGAKITGHFWAIDPAREPNAFSAFTPHERGAFLQMEDGRWWKCTLQPNGEAAHQRGTEGKAAFYPAGQMPKVE